MTRELYKLLSVITSGGSSVKSHAKYMKTIQTPFTFDLCFTQYSLVAWEAMSNSKIILTDGRLFQQEQKVSNISCCNMDRPVFYLKHTHTHTHAHTNDYYADTNGFTLFAEYCHFCLQSLALNMHKYIYNKFCSKWQLAGSEYME